MTISQKKASLRTPFFIRETISQTVSSACINQGYICCYKSNIPKEVLGTKNKFAIQNLVSNLVKNAFQAYQGKPTNKIILINACLDIGGQISISATSGGRSIPFLQKKFIEQANLVLMDNHKNTEIYSIAKIVKKELRGKIKIISKPRKGFTIICSFMLI